MKNTFSEASLNLPKFRRCFTGENWEQGQNIHGDRLFRGSAEINIFNVDKINKDHGRIKTMREYIGKSYFEYLAALPDLVLLMDEAHRYRAKGGMKAVAELNPVLGLELTATPRTTGARSERFKNVIYEYSLSEAMRHGYVKEPAVATRKDFRPDSVSPEQLERIKLEDGIHCHETVKADLNLKRPPARRREKATQCEHCRGLPAIISTDKQGRLGR